MNALRVCAAAAIAFCPGVYADEQIARIAGMAMTDGGAQAFLEQLTDSIGGRVTGSAESKATADLLLSTLQRYGLENAHFEEYGLESRWQRGPSHGSILSPIVRPLIVGSYAWVPGTQGEVTAPLVDLGAPPSADLSGQTDRLRGAAVIVEPHEVQGHTLQVMRADLARVFARAGAAAMLIPSDKPHRMVFTSAFGFYPAAPLPIVSVAGEDVLLLRRLLRSGPVRISLSVANTFDSKPAQERNVIADIKGTMLDEVVLVGAHFDSWDPGQGAQDDGVGVAAVLETARILKALGIKPRRTIRFAFFSGEEQALLGSRAYVQAHRSELDTLRAVIIMDTGAERPRGFQIHGRSDIEAAARTLLTPLSSLGAAGVSLEASFDMDHAPFMVAGIPVFTLWVEPGQYDVHHHAASDTLDKVDPRMLALDTAVMAVATYRLADAPQTPGRRLSEAEATHLLQQAGLESTRRMVYGAGEQ